MLATVAATRAGAATGVGPVGAAGAEAAVTEGLAAVGAATVAGAVPAAADGTAPTSLVLLLNFLFCSGQEEGKCERGTLT